ncbi:MAG: ATP synthase F1 subunit epsilon [Lachnospiraceae bacterium]|nr:ATP synthase F1 subunit epsilon [Lachnospiraceae bacterium]MCR5344682.1 ATP synthase F1 subunit epsilon [Lachnospiraceae bacterium]
MADEKNLFDIEIICPERVFYKGQATMVEFNSTEGELGVYKMHQPTTTVIAPGVVTIHELDGIKKAAVHSGFAEIKPEKVSILAEIAEWPEEIDVERAKAAKDRAEKRLSEHAEGTDIIRAEVALKKALVRLETRK